MPAHPAGTDIAADQDVVHKPGLADVPVPGFSVDYPPDTPLLPNTGGLRSAD